MFDINKIADWNECGKLKSEGFDYVNDLMKEMNFKFIASGHTRRVFRSPNKRFVLKFPLTKHGVYCSQQEAKYYNKYKKDSSSFMDGMHLAPCRLIQDTVLMMWAVHTTFSGAADNDLSGGCEHAIDHGLIKQSMEGGPEWIRRLDCSQAGILANGKVVAYDYPSFQN